MAELKCKDGTIIKISDETEAELRKAFRPEPPSYTDYALRVFIKDTDFMGWPIAIRIANDCVQQDTITRNIKDTEAFIAALQEAVTYCKRYDLGT